MSKAMIWSNGKLEERPCKILEVKPDKKKEGIILFKIQYNRNFALVEQWVPADRLVSNEKV